ncbi:putative ribonuclease H-like domain-containing protein [Tanacetum coccineum]
MHTRINISSQTSQSTTTLIFVCTPDKSHKIRCDNGTEFKNRVMNQFCEMKGIKREFSVASTPQQNGVAKWKNRTLIEAARTMLADSKLPTIFWAEAVNTLRVLSKWVLVLSSRSGPNWLFDIDALTNSMNYKPVALQGRNQSNDVNEKYKSM